MPRSIQQFKHRTILFDAIQADQLAHAVRVLERLPGVSAFADTEKFGIAVEYWVDEYLLSDLEMELAQRGFTMAGGIRNHILRTEIQHEEEQERDATDSRPSLCRSGGVFAHTYRPRRYDYEALPLCI